MSSAAEEYRGQTTSLPTAIRLSSTASICRLLRARVRQVSPINGEVLTKIAACDKEDVERAVKSARAAFDKGTWARALPKKRKTILVKLAGS